MPTSPQENRAADPKNGAKQPPFREKSQDNPGDETQMNVKPDHGEESYVGKGRLVGKTALITGGDSGIGRAVAIAFAREGADVAIAYLSEDADADETKRWIEKAGRRALTVKVDLSEERACADLVKQVADAFGRIDVLVNNAAFQGKAAQSIEEIDPARIERTFRVNIMAMFHLVRSALPHMKPGSAVINTGSIQAYDPSFNILDYASTKGAIVTFTKGLAQDLMRRGVRVNCVAPGATWTPLVAQSYDEKKLEKFGAQSPIGRPAQPKELAPAYVFLASDEASYVAGEVLGVTGGRPLA